MTKSKDTVIQRTLHTASDLRVREAAEGQGESRTITGYAILFGVRSAPFYDYDGEVGYEVIAPTAITKELLDGCDIKMTMFHNRQLILARSKNGEGTLSYSVDDKGVAFEFDAPRTADGDKALELVRRGDISGCSFAFTTHYFDRAFVSREVTTEDGKRVVTNVVKTITGVYDFTLAADPAYPDTNCEAQARELMEDARKEEAPQEEDTQMREQIKQMRKIATASIL